MDKDAYEQRAADRQKRKDAVSVAPEDIKELSSDEIHHRKEELARLNEEQLNDFKENFDIPSSPKDGTQKSDAG